MFGDTSRAKRRSTRNDEEDGKLNFVKLEDMTNFQLESICTNRGFELQIGELKDERNGQPLNWTHNDYVEAAQQCLDVEAELMLKKNPNIVKDLERERDEMLARKEQLELELAAKRHQAKQMKADGRRSSSSSSGSGTGSSGTTSSRKQSRYESIKKDKIRPIPDFGKVSTEDYDRLKFAKLFKDSMMEFKAQARRDFEYISNIVLPKSVRGPMNEKVIRPLIRIARKAGLSAFDMLKRYVLAMMQSADNKSQK